LLKLSLNGIISGPFPAITTYLAFLKKIKEDTHSTLIIPTTSSQTIWFKPPIKKRKFAVLKLLIFLTWVLVLN
jgi:hypothetical protein